MTETEEDRKLLLINMHLCLDIAERIHALLTTVTDDKKEGVFALRIDEVLKVIKPLFPTPLADERKHALGRAMAAAIRKYQLEECLIWDLAHSLEHILFEEDLSNLRD